MSLKTKIDTINTNIVNGKSAVENAIIAKGGTVAKTAAVPTFNELKLGIDGITTGSTGPGYQVGDVLLYENVEDYRDPNQIVVEMQWEKLSTSNNQSIQWQGMDKRSDGKYLLYGNYGYVYLVNPADGTDSMLSTGYMTYMYNGYMTSNDIWYGASLNKTVYKVNAAGAGSLVWQSPANALNSVTYSVFADTINGFVYSGHQNGDIMKLNDADGTKVWEKASTGIGTVYGLTMGSDGFIYAGGAQNLIKKIDPADGTMVDFATPPNGGQIQFIRTEGDYLLVGTTGYRFIKYNLDGTIAQQLSTTYAVTSLAQNPLHSYYLLGSTPSGYVMKVDKTNFTLIETLATGHSGYIEAVILDDDEAFATASGDKTAKKHKKMPKKIGYKIIS